MKSYKQLFELELGPGPGAKAGMPQGSSAGDAIVIRQRIEQLHIWFYTLSNPTPKGEKVNPQIAEKIAMKMGINKSKMDEIGKKMQAGDRKTCEMVWNDYVGVPWDKRHPVNDAKGEGKKKVMQKKFIPKGRL